MYDIPTTKSKVYGEYQPCCPCPVRYFRFENNGIEQRNIEKREENVSSNYDSITYTRQVDGYTIYTPPSYMYLPYSEWSYLMGCKYYESVSVFVPLVNIYRKYYEYSMMISNIHMYSLYRISGDFYHVDGLECK